MFEQTIDIERIEQIVNLFGNFDENIKRIEKRYGVAITSHGSAIKVKGEVDGVVSACRTIEGLITMINKGEQITDRNVDYVASLVDDGEEGKIGEITDVNCICITSKGKPVKPKTLGQKQYVE
ncbi:MAG: phosphate starvation-inducible protein PhoH, partial [Clostridia bacterium]|nr:phosphate starvation-inducible protein PhoH [Clostridia bacterium]